MVALAHYIINYDKYDMLLETDSTQCLEFVINNTLTLRNFIGD